MKSTLKSIRRVNDFEPFLLGRIADEIELIVMHPEDLKVSIDPMHPATDKLITKLDLEELKHWRLEAGILPFQGLELSWRR